MARSRSTSRINAVRRVRTSLANCAASPADNRIDPQNQNGSLAVKSTMPTNARSPTANPGSTGLLAISETNARTIAGKSTRIITARGISQVKLSPMR